MIDDIANRFGSVPPALEAPLEVEQLWTLVARLRVTRIETVPTGIAGGFIARTRPTRCYVASTIPLRGAPVCNGAGQRTLEPDEAGDRAAR